MPYIAARSAVQVLVPVGQKIAVAYYGGGQAIISYQGISSPLYYEAARLSGESATYGPFPSDRMVQIEAGPTEQVQYAIDVAPSVTSSGGGATAAFNPTSTFAANTEVIYAGGVYKFTAQHTGQWTGADATYLRQAYGTLNTVGNFKPFGMQAQYTAGAFATSTTTTSSSSAAIKLQAEAPFFRVKVGIFHKEAAPQRANCYSFAATETESLSSISNAVDPIVGGTAHSVLASAADANGFRIATWGGGGISSRIQAPAGTTFPGKGYSTDVDVAWSDWVECKSVPNVTTPGGRPLLVARKSGWSTIGDATSNIGSGIMAAEYNKFIAGNPLGRLMYMPAVGAGDHVLDPTLSKSAAVLYDPTVSTVNRWANAAYLFQHAVPTRNFGGFGDSITEGYAWWQNAVRTLSTQQAPCYIFNYGLSTNASAQYFAALKTMLMEDIYLTDILIPTFTPNALTVQNDFTIQQFKIEIMEIIELCNRMNLRLYIWTSYAQYTSAFVGIPVSVAAIASLNQWVRDNASTYGYRVIDIADGWDNATMIGDGTHPGAVGITYMTAKTLTAIQGA